MRYAWRAAAIRAAEEALLATLPPGALMQRAAAGLARRCARLLSDRYQRVYGCSAVVLVGSGNNGGDALFAGARLASRGVRVRAMLVDPARAHRDGLATLLAAGGEVIARAPSTVDLVVDGILGIGGRGWLRDAAAEAVKHVGEAPARDGGRPIVVAVDLPSGVDVDTGAVPGEAVRADVTVTFGALKPGLLVGAGAIHSGFVELVDIGLERWLPGEPALGVPELSDVRQWWPQPVPGDDKYTRGVVGVATGSPAYPGAALLSVAGALAGPSGMVRYAGATADLVRQRYPTVVSTERVGDAGRVQAWVCGCGLGSDERAVTELRTALSADVPVCLDADALGALSGSAFGGALSRRVAPTVLTPHDREYTRLAGHEPGPDRVEAALRLAVQTRAVVLLKGDHSVVATPDGRAYVNPTGVPALATAGTGDVLAGLLGALLASGLRADRAAMAAAYAHGLAARHAARQGAITAVDVAAAIPSALSVAGPPS